MRRYAETVAARGVADTVRCTRRGDRHEHVVRSPCGATTSRVVGRAAWSSAAAYGHVGPGAQRPAGARRRAGEVAAASGALVCASTSSGVRHGVMTSGRRHWVRGSIVRGRRGAVVRGPTRYGVLGRLARPCRARFQVGLKRVRRGHVRVTGGGTTVVGFVDRFFIFTVQAMNCAIIICCFMQPTDWLGRRLQVGSW